ncbi:putative las17-binding protein actin regulator [Lyophyllum shimeji]|uniref:Las17-binding protein actin regulator n=1 Tax=Lyophyllum shimeji TaxID=47721 RepID=A0A9P3UM93_LYOSH|nr:putative las17-binding protein actin regulator [Lyophyllum shimeji]
MKLNTPLPQPLPKECTKAARIFKSFVDGSNNGLDGVIPRSVLENAKGFAIFTVFKAGLLFSARAGSGIVIARLQDGRLSAPSAIGITGLGAGCQAGAEVTDFLIVLNTRSAIQTFMAAGSLTLGGNLSIALGPLGRNGEAIGSVNTSGKVAAMYSYSKTRGFFGGISVEGSVIVERQDANSIAYRSPVTARLLLGGAVNAPEWTSDLIQTLDSCTGMPGGRKWVQDGIADGTYVFGGLASPSAESNGTSYLRKKRKSSQPSFPPSTWGTPKDSGSYFTTDEISRTSNGGHITAWARGHPSFPTEARFESDFDTIPHPTRHTRLSQSLSYSSTRPLDTTFDDPVTSRSHGRSYSMASPRFTDAPSPNPFADSTATTPRSSVHDDGRRASSSSYIAPKPELLKALEPHEGVGRAIALYDFKAVEPGDLSFAKGDVITIVKKSGSSDDWWTGKRGGYEGLFPANFVEVV